MFSPAAPHLGMDGVGIRSKFLLATEAPKRFGARNEGVEFMSTIRTLGFAVVAALSLGVGAAMAQEGPNATVSGSTFCGSQAPLVQAPAARPGIVPSGSSDMEVQPTTNSHYYWTPGIPYNNEGGMG
jgi:hypothetical protein